jgi:hypothetical protein
MPQLAAASPRLTVRLFKTISRKTIDGKAGVSARYEGKDESIDLTGYLGDGAVVRTCKSVREPAGGFSITFADKADTDFSGGVGYLSSSVLETVYGLVEPMDLVEIRMWSGAGAAPVARLGLMHPRYPIVMRGFVSAVQRQQSMTEDGRPQRQVVITGQDYGKIWQMFQVIYLAAYAEGKALLTNFGLWELFGATASNALPAADFIRTMVEKIINPHLGGFMPERSTMPRQLTLGGGITVAHGVVNNSYQQMQGSLYEIMRFHGDVGVWNELYTEDREDGVHVVYRPVPALDLSTGKKIQEDAPSPVYVSIPAWAVQSISVCRSDESVGNFFWVNNSRFDLVDEMQRKLASIPANDGRVSLKEYPNTAVKYYGVRPMYASTQQGDDQIANMTSGQKKDDLDQRSTRQEAWIDKRRRLMMEMNKDNVVFERGTARVKGGPMRADGVGLMKAGDYARFQFGSTESIGYVVQIEHEFAPFRGFTTNLVFERGTGFAERIKMGGPASPWLAEQATNPQEFR